MPTGKETKSLGLLALAGLQPYEPKADEEYMGEPQMEHFRLLLKAWRNQLREEVDRTVTHMKDEAANFPDPVDRAARGILEGEWPARRLRFRQTQSAHY